MKVNCADHKAALVPPLALGAQQHLRSGSADRLRYTTTRKRYVSKFTLALSLVVIFLKRNTVLVIELIPPGPVGGVFRKAEFSKEPVGQVVLLLDEAVHRATLGIEPCCYGAY